MNLKKTFGRAAVTAAVTVGVVGLGLSGVAAAGPVQSEPKAVNAPLSCTIQTNNTGNYLTAVGGGGRTTDVIHTDATRARSWERFTLIDSGDAGANIYYGIKTHTGNYLTAVGGGNRITDVIHSDATLLRSWEKFSFISKGNGLYAIQTITGNYLTAVGGGGRITDVIHSDATVVKAWELFRVSCVAA